MLENNHSAKAQNRIVFISNFYPPIIVGGAEVVAHRQALAVKSLGWDVVVFAGMFPSESSPSGSLMVDEHEGITVYRVAMDSLDPDSNFVWSLGREYFRAIVSSHKLSWAFFHNTIGLGADLIPVAKAMGLKVAITLHDNWGHCFKNTRLRSDGSVCDTPGECTACQPTITTTEGIRLPIRMRRDFVAWCVEQADILISPSQSLAQLYADADVAKNRITVISNGIDLQNIRATYRSGDSQIRFLSASHIGEHKGILPLLDAAKNLWSRKHLRGRWNLSIAGDGHLVGLVKSRIASGEFGDSVNYLGKLSRADLVHTIEGSHAIVLASIWPENEPVVLLEAIASGAVPIATRIGGNTELINDGVTGLLVDRNDPAALGDAMARIIDNSDSFIEAASKANLERREALSEERSIKRVASLLTNPPLAREGDDTIIICGQGMPDYFSSPIVESLSYLTERKIKLIWNKWADSQIWHQAIGYWHWNLDDFLGNYELASRYGLPIVTRGAPLTTASSKFMIGVRAYADPLEFSDIIEGLAAEHGNATLRRSSTAPALMRAYNVLRDRSGFYLHAQSFK